MFHEAKKNLGGFTSQGPKTWMEDEKSKKKESHGIFVTGIVTYLDLLFGCQIILEGCQYTIP